MLFSCRKRRRKNQKECPARWGIVSAGESDCIRGGYQHHRARARSLLSTWVGCFDQGIYFILVTSKLSLPLAQTAQNNQNKKFRIWDAMCAWVKRIRICRCRLCSMMWCDLIVDKYLKSESFIWQIFIDNQQWMLPGWLRYLSDTIKDCQYQRFIGSCTRKGGCQILWSWCMIGKGFWTSRFASPGRHYAPFNLFFQTSWF